MLQFDSNAPIYLGTADNAIHNDQLSAEEHLLFEQNVLTILGHRVLVGTPFVWQSKATLSSISKSLPLLELENVGLRLTSREEVSSALDYFHQREADTRLLRDLTLRSNSPFLMEQPGAAPLDWRNTIGPEIRVEPRYSSVERHFRSLIVNDAAESSDAQSLMRLTANSYGARFSRHGRRRSEYILTSLSERTFSGHFSRAAVEDELVRNSSDSDLISASLMRTTALYQLASTAAHRASLFTTPEVASRVPRGHDFPVLDRWTVSPLNPYLFAAVLGCLGVPHRAWAKLDPLIIAQISYVENPLSAFAVHYKNATRARVLRWIRAGRIPRFQQAVTVLQNDLLRGDRWRSLEIFSQVARKKYSPYVFGAAAMASYGLGPLMLGTTTSIGGAIGFGKATKDVSKMIFDIGDEMSLLEIVLRRATLRKYLYEIGVL